MPYAWNLKRNDTNELIYKTERDSKTENELMVARGQGMGRMGKSKIREFGMNFYSVLYLKW